MDGHQLSAFCMGHLQEGLHLEQGSDRSHRNRAGRTPVVTSQAFERVSIAFVRSILPVVTAVNRILERLRENEMPGAVMH